MVRVFALLTLCLALPAVAVAQNDDLTVLNAAEKRLLDEADRIAEAQTLYNESLAIYRVLGDKWALAYLLEDVGWMAAQRGQARLALRLVAAASVLREQIGTPLTATETSKLEGALEPARKTLGASAQAAWDEGQAMSLDEAIECALSR